MLSRSKLITKLHSPSVDNKIQVRLSIRLALELQLQVFLLGSKANMSLDCEIVTNLSNPIATLLAKPPSTLMWATGIASWRVPSIELPLFCLYCWPATRAISKFQTNPITPLHNTLLGVPLRSECSSIISSQTLMPLQSVTCLPRHPGCIHDPSWPAHRPATWVPFSPLAPLPPQALCSYNFLWQGSSSSIDSCD